MKDTRIPHSARGLRRLWWLPMTVLLACGRDAEPSRPDAGPSPGGAVLAGGQGAAFPTARPTSASAARGGNRREAGDATTLSTVLADFTLQAPSTVTAGPVAFHVSNRGRHRHALRLAGPSTDRKTKPLAPGEEAVLEVRLTPGHYTLTCPLHEKSDGQVEHPLTVL